MRRGSARRPWSDGEEGRVRVLVECEPEFAPSIIASVIERHGFEVRTCDGPHGAGCDLLENGACALVDGADVVVNMLCNREPGRRVLSEVAGLRRPPAVVAEMTQPQVLAATGTGGDAPAVDLERVTVIEMPVKSGALIDAINAAAGSPVERLS